MTSFKFIESNYFTVCLDYQPIFPQKYAIATNLGDIFLKLISGGILAVVFDI